jgi:hypothetical protein
VASRGRALTVTAPAAICLNCLASLSAESQI